MDKIEIEDIIDSVYCVSENEYIHIGILTLDDNGDLLIYEPRTLLHENDLVKLKNPYFVGNKEFPIRISYNSSFSQFTPTDEIMQLYLKLISDSSLFGDVKEPVENKNPNYELIVTTFQ